VPGEGGDSKVLPGRAGGPGDERFCRRLMEFGQNFQETPTTSNHPRLSLLSDLEGFLEAAKVDVGGKGLITAFFFVFARFWFCRF